MHRRGGTRARIGGAGVLAAALVLSGCSWAERVDLASNGTPAPNAESPGYLSADGRYDAFLAFSPLVAGDANQEGDAYVRDVLNDTTERVSLSATGGDPDGRSAPSGISADGRYVLFWSWATNLVAGGTAPSADDFPNLYVRDRVAGTTTLITPTTDGQAPDGFIQNARLSADGHFVVFETPATNILAGANANREDVYVRDVVAGTTSRVSVNTNEVVANNDSTSGGISSDGNLVVFESTAGNLGGTAGYNHVYVRNRSAGTTIQVDVPLSGTSNGGAVPADQPLSTNGRYVLFNAWADNLTVDDPVGTTDVYVRDLQTNTTSLVYSPSGVPAAGDPVPLLALNPVGISDDGQTVAINGLRSGSASNLTDFQGYVVDRTGPRITMVRARSGAAFAKPARIASLSADGNYLAFATDDPAMPGSFVRSAGTPVVSAVAPGVRAPGTSGSLAVTGSGLVPGTIFDLGAGVTVDHVTVTDARHVTLDVTVAAGAAPGPRTIVITGPGSGPGPDTGAVGVAIGVFSVG